MKSFESLTVILPLVVACSAPPTPLPRTPQQTPSPVTTSTSSKRISEPPATNPAGDGLALRLESFGDARPGFVEASTSNGRFVLIRRFPAGWQPRFGHHGETDVAPEFTAFDRFSGEERTIDDLIDIDSSRRWLLILANGLWLVDGLSGRWEELVDVDMSPDGNACLPPRQANFSADGRKVAWIDRGATGLLVRDLEAGDDWIVRSSARLWRGWPDEQDRGAILAEVPASSEGWPVQKTSCACRWCNRFAMSYGMYGWSGPTFALEHVKGDGTREKAGDPPSSNAPWHGPTSDGCKLEAAQEIQTGLDRGPWRWICSGEPKAKP